MTRSPRGWNGRFELEWRIRGELFRETARNALYNQGEQDILEFFFRGSDAASPAPTVFHLGLLGTGYSVTETDGMTEVAAAELTEATAPGYGTTSARKEIARSSTGWVTSALDNGDWRLTSAQVIWTASGAWSATAGFVFLACNSTASAGATSGRIMAVASLSPPRQLQAVSDSLKITYLAKLS